MSDTIYDYEAEDDCTMCGGDGYTPCNDWIQCTRRHFGNGWDQYCECAACNGSGQAKDQTIW